MASDPTGLLSQLLQYNGQAGQRYDDAVQSGQQQQQNSLILSAQAAKQAQAQQYQQDVETYYKNPTTSALAQLAVKYPDQADALKKSYDIMDADKKQSVLTQFGGLYSAAQNGRTDLLKTQLSSLKAAEQAQGIDTSDIDDALTGLNSPDPAAQSQAIKSIEGFSQMHLAAAQPEKFPELSGIGGKDDGTSTHVINPGGALVDNTGKELYRADDKPTYEKVTNADGSESLVQVGGGEPAAGPASAAPGGSGTPLSVRLNNPGAIRASAANKWQGQVGTSNGFVQFDTPENGARAHRILIANQIQAGYDTPEAWAAHYAPASDGNNPEAYAKTIATGLGIGVNDKIPLSAVPKVASLSAGVEAGGTPAPSTALVGAGPAASQPGVKVLYTSKPANAGQDAATVEFYGQKVAAGGDLPQLGMGKEAAALRQAILARSAQIQQGEGMSGGDSNLLHADVKTSTTALTALQRTRNSLNPFLQTFDGASAQVRALAPQAVGGSIPIFNRWVQAGRTNVTGDPPVSRFNVAINAVANENAKIMSGASGGAVSSDSARHEAMSLINNAQTLDQLNAALDQMHTDTQIRVKSLDDRQAQLRNTISGRPAAPSASPRVPAPPAIGEVRRGFRFNGGNPASPQSWAKVG